MNQLLGNVVLKNDLLFGGQLMIQLSFTRYHVAPQNNHGSYLLVFDKNENVHPLRILRENKGESLMVYANGEQKVDDDFVSFIKSDLKQMSDFVVRIMDSHQLPTEDLVEQVIAGCNRMLGSTKTQMRQQSNARKEAKKQIGFGL